MAAASVELLNLLNLMHTKGSHTSNVEDYWEEL